MNLESTLRKVAKPVALFGTAAYLTLNLIACSGSAAPTVTPTTSTPPAATATVAATPTPRRPEDTPTPQYKNTPTPTPTATPPLQPPTVTPRPPTPTVTPTPTATPIVGFTDEQLKQKLGGLEEILRANDDTLDADGNDYKGYAAKITDALDAGYFLFTGRTLQQDRISILPLVKKDFDAYIDKLPYTADVKANMKATYLGFAWDALNRKTGKYDYSLVIRGDFTPTGVFTFAAHEAERPFSDSLNPNIRNSTWGSLVLGEARPTLFSTGIYRSIEEFSGERLSDYAMNEENVRHIADRLSDFQKALKGGATLENFPLRGYVLSWAAAQEKGLLKEGQRTRAKELYALFQTMVMDDTFANGYVDGLMARLVASDPNLNFIRQNALSRLIPNYPKEKQGPIRFETSILRP